MPSSETRHIWEFSLNQSWLNDIPCLQKSFSTWKSHELLPCWNLQSNWRSVFQHSSTLCCCKSDLHRNAEHGICGHHGIQNVWELVPFEIGMFRCIPHSHMNLEPSCLPFIHIMINYAAIVVSSGLPMIISFNYHVHLSTIRIRSKMVNRMDWL